MSNTHPNTPFGKFFEKEGVWHANPIDTIKAIIANHKQIEADAVSQLSVWLNTAKTLVLTLPPIVLKELKVSQEEIEKVAADIEAVLVKLK